MIKAELTVHNLTKSENYQYMLNDTVFKASTPEMLNCDDFEKWISLVVNELMKILKKGDEN